jgi:hypothetical protein
MALLSFLLAVACIGYFIWLLRLGLKGSDLPEAQKSKIFWFSLSFVLAYEIGIGYSAWQGGLRDFSTFPPRPLPLVFLPMLLVLYLAFFSAKTRLILSAIPPQYLIGFQSFRVVVEIILWQNFKDGVMPIQMTFEGRNYDMLVGLTALPVAYFCFIKKSWSPRIAFWWNIGGLGLLANIVIIAVLSMPTPIRYFKNEPANYLVGEFPFIYIPTVFVLLAFAGHVFSMRRRDGGVKK